MNNLKGTEPQIEADGDLARLTRIEGPALAPGHYWRCKNEIKRVCVAGDVLLIVDVRQDGDEDHRVDLLAHPRYQDYSSSYKSIHQMLVHDFLETFTPAADAESVREKEVNELRAQSTAVTLELHRAQEDPGYLNRMSQLALAEKAGENGSRATALALPGGLTAEAVLTGELPTMSTFLAAGIGISTVADAQRLIGDAASIIQARAGWLKSRTEEVARLSTAMIPYLVERAESATARVRRDLARANRLLSQVATLDLFTGNGVVAEVLIDGEPAAPGTPVTLYQAKLYLDEEASYFSQYAGNKFNCTSSNQAWDAVISTPALLDQMIPAQRGAVLVSYSRSWHWMRPNITVFEASALNDADQRSWLLVRDGQRLLLVGSPDGSHHRCDKLFPELDVDGKVFRGTDGQHITPADLEWTDKLSELQVLAVHYRRWSVLLAGLVTRNEVWSGMDPFDLLSADRSGRLNYVRDASGEGLLANPAPSLKDYWDETNARIRQGATVAIDAGAVTDDSAPAAFVYVSGSGHELRYSIDLPNEPLLLPVKRDGSDLYVSFPCQRHAKPHSLRVRLMTNGHPVDSSTWLVSDGVDPRRLDQLLSSRGNRRNYVGRFPLLHAARNAALEREAATAPLRAWAIESLLSAGIVKAATDTLVREVLVAVQDALMGVASHQLPAPGTPQAQPVLDAVYFALGVNAQSDLERLEAALEGTDVRPLRFTREPDGSLLLYAAPAAPDHRGAAQLEVDRYRVIRGARGSSLRPLSDGLMFENTPGHTDLKVWPEAEALVCQKTPPHRRNVRVAAANLVDRYAIERRAILQGKGDPDIIDQLFEAMESVARPYVRRRGRMPHLWLAVPVGVISDPAGRVALATGLVAAERVIRGLAGASPELATRMFQMWKRLHARDEYAQRLAGYLRDAPNADDLLPSLANISPAETKGLQELIWTGDWKSARFRENPERYLTANHKGEALPPPPEARFWHLAEGWQFGHADPFRKWLKAGSAEGLNNDRQPGKVE